MSFNRNTSLIGQHAWLSPSSYAWLDYDEDKLRRVYFEKQQAARGDRLHVYAQQAITLGIKQADNGTTLSMYINDAIGFRQTPEVLLVYSPVCFGTADACGIRSEKGVMTLRISDLKTGVKEASMKQLLIYCGLFFLEYKPLFNPRDVLVILRIYQNDAIVEHQPEIDEILWYMDRIKTQSQIVTWLREED